MDAGNQKDPQNELVDPHTVQKLQSADVDPRQHEPPNKHSATRVFETHH
jgi:hypothetical protein